MIEPNTEISLLHKSKGSLSFKTLVMAPFIGDKVFNSLKSPIEIRLDSFDKVLKKVSPIINIEIENRSLCELIHVEQQTLRLEYEINILADFLPANIVQREPNLNDIARLIEQIHLMLHQDSFVFSAEQFDCRELEVPQLTQKHIKRFDLELLVCELEALLSTVINDVLHQKNWQKLESAWRGLFWLCHTASLNDTCCIECVSVDRNFLNDDLMSHSDVEESDFYQMLYINSFGQYGAIPYGALMIDDYFSACYQDIALLKKITEVCAIAHIPVVTGIKPQMFDVDNFNNLQEISSLSEIHSGLRFIKWRSFINESDASYLSLVMPRILIRETYSKGEHDLPWFEESIGNDHEFCLWGNASFAFMTNLIRSFAKHGFCTFISGDDGGVLNFVNFSHTSLPVEVSFSEDKEAELIKLGFNPICTRAYLGRVLFQSANSVRWGSLFFNQKIQSVNSIASAQLQYLFIVLRIIHCLKIIFRDKIGAFENGEELSIHLNRWLRQFVADVESPVKSLRAQRPLRDGRIIVTDGENIGWYDISIEIVPHLKYLGDFVSFKTSVPLEAAS